MPTDEVTQADRDAANAWWYAKSTAGVDPNEDLATYLAQYRTASEQRGYDRAIAEVVAWLREGAHYKPSHLGPSMLNVFGKMATAIEAGEHKP